MVVPIRPPTQPLLAVDNALRSSSVYSEGSSSARSKPLGV